MADETNPADVPRFDEGAAVAASIPRAAAERPRQGSTTDTLRDDVHQAVADAHRYEEGYNAGIAEQANELSRLRGRLDTAEKDARELRQLMLFALGLIIGLLLASSPRSSRNREEFE